MTLISRLVHFMHDINNYIKKVVHLNVFQGLNAELPVAVVDFHGILPRSTTISTLLSTKILFRAMPQINQVVKDV